MEAERVLSERPQEEKEEEEEARAQEVTPPPPEPIEPPVVREAAEEESGVRRRRPAWGALERGKRALGRASVVSERGLEKVQRQFERVERVRGAALLLTLLEIGLLASLLLEYYLGDGSVVEGYVLLLNLVHLATWFTGVVAVQLRVNPWYPLMLSTMYLWAARLDVVAVAFRIDTLVRDPPASRADYAALVVRVVTSVALALLAVVQFGVNWVRQRQQIRMRDAFYRAHGYLELVGDQSLETRRARVYLPWTFVALQVYFAVARFDFLLVFIGFFAFLLGAYPAFSGRFPPALLFAGHITLWYSALAFGRGGAGRRYPPAIVRPVPGLWLALLLYGGVLLADTAGAVWHFVFLLLGVGLDSPVASVGFFALWVRFARWFWLAYFALLEALAFTAGVTLVIAQLRLRKQQRVHRRDVREGHVPDKFSYID
jgi:hypothetical protein